MGLYVADGDGDGDGDGSGDPDIRTVAKCNRYKRVCPCPVRVCLPTLDQSSPNLPATHVPDCPRSRHLIAIAQIDVQTHL